MLVETRKISKGKEVTVVTSLDVAETFEKEHRRVLQDIRDLKCSEEFRLHNFVQSSYINEQGRNQSMFIMTRDGFTLLAMSYTGEKAMKFKEAYINQFNEMEELLKGKLIEREKGIAVRQSLTKAIQQSSENERMHGHAYSTYTDIVYRTVFGKTAKQLREEYGIDKKANLRDYFTVEELEKVQSIEMIISGLVNCGWGYNEIKEFITNPAKKLIAA
jgi:Rha family phage regulatory protein